MKDFHKRGGRGSVRFQTFIQKFKHRKNCETALHNVWIEENVLKRKVLGQIGRSGRFARLIAHNNDSVDKVGKLWNFVNFDKLSQNYENLLNIMKFRQYCEIFFFVKIVKFCQRNFKFCWNYDVWTLCASLYAHAKQRRLRLVWFGMNWT